MFRIVDTKELKGKLQFLIDNRYGQILRSGELLYHLNNNLDYKYLPNVLLSTARDVAKKLQVSIEIRQPPENFVYLSKKDYTDMMATFRRGEPKKCAEIIKKLAKTKNEYVYNKVTYGKNHRYLHKFIKEYNA